MVQMPAITYRGTREGLMRTLAEARAVYDTGPVRNDVIASQTGHSQDPTYGLRVPIRASRDLKNINELGARVFLEQLFGGRYSSCQSNKV